MSYLPLIFCLSIKRHDTNSRGRKKPFSPPFIGNKFSFPFFSHSFFFVENNRTKLFLTKFGKEQTFLFISIILFLFIHLLFGPSVSRVVTSRSLCFVYRNVFCFYAPSNHIIGCLVNCCSAILLSKGGKCAY